MGQSPSIGYRIPYISIISISILSLFPLLALASPAAFESDVEKRNDTEECGFVGDDNTYGLGIRLGIYLQWITSSIAYNFVPDEAVTMRGVNNCFQAAMFAGLLFITITKGSELYAVEAFMMLIFCMGGVCSGDNPTEVGEKKPKKFAYFDATTLGSLIRFSLGVGFCGYGVWFTFKGMDNMKHPPCSTFAFFIVRVNLYGWFRTFWKVMFTLGAVVYAGVIINGSPYLIIKYWHFLWGRPAGQGSAVQGQTGGSDPKAGDTTSTSNITFSTALILFIVGVEMMVWWNHIEGVNSLGSTGQLLPLIIGVGGTFRVIHSLFAELFGKLFNHSSDGGTGRRGSWDGGTENSGSVTELANIPPCQSPRPAGG